MNLASIIEPHPAATVALISRGRQTTYGQLREQVAAMRGGLVGLGIQPGDRVAIICENIRAFVDAYLATLGIGAVAVPLNPTNPAPAIQRELAEVGAVAVVIGPAARSSWASVDRASVPTVAHVIVVDAEADSDDGSLRLDDLLASAPAPLVDVPADHLAALLFTSGTAGAPRAAMLTHGNLSSNLEQSRSSGRFESSDVVFGVLPLHHIFGLNVMLGQTLAAGASIVLVHRFDPSTLIDTIEERGVTVVPGAPPLWVALSQFSSAPPNAFAGVRLALTGASKMPEDAAAAFEARFGIPILEGYGLTEASPVVTTSAGIEVRPGSVGRVLAGIEVRLVDAAGEDVLQDDAGEIWLRGPNVFAGYWRDPEATARVLTKDGWLRTGDMAVMDHDGYLFIVDRAKDLIIVSGFNVYPAEVEEVIADMAGVAEVAVIGVPHPHTGEAVKAYVVALPGVVLHEEQVIEHCLDELARYKCPTKVLFVDELPRGISGKLLRRVLR